MLVIKKIFRSQLGQAKLPGQKLSSATTRRSSFSLRQQHRQKVRLISLSNQKGAVFPQPCRFLLLQESFSREAGWSKDKPLQVSRTDWLLDLEVSSAKKQQCASGEEKPKSYDLIRHVRSLFDPNLLFNWLRNVFCDGTCCWQMLTTLMLRQ